MWNEIKNVPIVEFVGSKTKTAHTFKKIMRDTYKTKSIKKNVVQNITHF